MRECPCCGSVVTHEQLEVRKAGFTVFGYKLKELMAIIRFAIKNGYKSLT
jgi:hypothetical protein